jgi:hypothetical protein
MNDKEKFMMFVYLGAIARDISEQKRDASLIAQHAELIPDDVIPPNTYNAARVYLRQMEGQSKPFNWMIPKTNNGKVSK